MNIVDVLPYRMSQRSSVIIIMMETVSFEMTLLYYVNAGGEHKQAVHMHFSC